MDILDFKTLIAVSLDKYKQKTEKGILELIFLGIMGGISIALGAVGYILIANDKTTLSRFLGASIFPVGLITIVLLSFELFTSNTMIFSGLVGKQIKLKKILKNIVLIYFSNLIGTTIVAAISIKANIFNEEALQYLHQIALAKIESNFLSVLFKGILCNILVCTGVLTSMSAKRISGKILAIWFPVMLFVVLGLEHSVANMFYLPATMISGNDIGHLQVFLNILSATIGNLIGGGLLMGIFLTKIANSKSSEIKNSDKSE